MRVSTLLWENRCCAHINSRCRLATRLMISCETVCWNCFVLYCIEVQGQSTCFHWQNGIQDESGGCCFSGTFEQDLFSYVNFAKRKLWQGSWQCKGLKRWQPNSTCRYMVQVSKQCMMYTKHKSTLCTLLVAAGGRRLQQRRSQL